MKKRLKAIYYLCKVKMIKLTISKRTEFGQSANEFFFKEKFNLEKLLSVLSTDKFFPPNLLTSLNESDLNVLNEQNQVNINSEYKLSIKEVKVY